MEEYSESPLIGTTRAMEIMAERGTPVKWGALTSWIRRGLVAGVVRDEFGQRFLFPESSLDSLPPAGLKPGWKKGRKRK